MSRQGSTFSLDINPQRTRKSQKNCEMEKRKLGVRQRDPNTFLCSSLATLGNLSLNYAGAKSRTLLSTGHFVPLHLFIKRSVRLSAIVVANHINTMFEWNAACTNVVPCKKW